MRQIDVVKKIFETKGYIDRNYCLQHDITGRLSAYMFILKRQGITYIAKYGRDLARLGANIEFEDEDNYYYLKPEKLNDLCN